MFEIVPEIHALLIWGTCFHGYFAASRSLAHNSVLLNNTIYCVVRYLLMLTQINSE